MEIYASILAADSLQLKKEISRAVRAGVDGIHIDVMDGHFVHDIMFGPTVTKSIRAFTSMQIDAHLMVSRPEKLIEEYCLIGVEQITVHYENCRDIRAAAEVIHRFGKRICVAVNLETSADLLSAVISEIDAVLIIAVTVGIGGQNFNPAALKKVEEISRMACEMNPEIIISVDGGVNQGNIGILRECGANRVIIGTALFKGPDMEMTLRKLRMASSRDSVSEMRVV